MDDKLKQLILLMELKNEEKFSDFSKSIEQLDKQDIEISNDVDLLYKELSKIEGDIKSFDVSEQIKELKSDIENIQLQKGDKGEDGKDYILTEEDKSQIANSIKIPVVEKVIETIKEVPIVTNEIIEVAKYENAEQIVEKINTLENVIEIKTIKDFPVIEGTADIKRQVDTIGNQVLRLLSKQPQTVDLSAYVPNTRTLTINGTAYDLSADRSWSVGTVTSVAALTLGTSGTDLSSSVATGTTTPVITLNVPTASATNRGALSSTDWTTFNAKESALTFSTGLTRTSNTITANLSTGISGGQSAIGGTGTGDSLILKSTTGVGTSSSWIKSQVGNNGAIESLRQGVVDSPDAVGSGGTVTTSGGYTIHTFTTSGTFIVGGGTLSVDYLVVAGGGGGGGTDGGGGGAGGMKTGTGFSVAAGSYSITVGAGGTGVKSSKGTNGGDSIFSTITATGGGGGGVYNNQTGLNGGSGGGGGANGGGSTAGGTGTAGQGNNGGSGKGPTNYAGAGGGGAGAVGGDAAATGSAGGGNGGAGSVSSISGSSVTYAGGGGGGTYLGTAGSGGAGGGGAGTNVNSGTGTAGTANTGGGGGGGGDTAGTGGAGGSGIVIIRYLTPTTTQRPVVGVNKSAPTAQLHLGAGVGNPYSAPLKFDSGTNLAVAEAGAMEYDGTSLFFTPSSTRYNVLMNGLGLAGGQTIVGGTASGNNLTLSSTSNATKGKILFGNSAYDEVNNRLGIGISSPVVKLHVLTGTYTAPVSDANYVVQNSGQYVAEYIGTNGGYAGFLVRGTGAGTQPFVQYYNTSTGKIWTQMMTTAGDLNILKGNALGTTLLTLGNNLNVGIANATPTARLHLGAGTATANTAPLKFTTGTNLTTAEAGAMEYNNTPHFTNSDATRRHIALSPSATKTTASAPYTNDGYIIINIGGTDFKVMTTA